MRRHYVYVLLLAAGMWAGCSEKKDDTSGKEKEGMETVLPSQANEVTVMTLKRTTFNHELVSNGKVTASQYADLSFRLTSEPVAHIYVKKRPEDSRTRPVHPEEQPGEGGDSPAPVRTGDEGRADRAGVCTRPHAVNPQRHL